MKLKIKNQNFYLASNNNINTKNHNIKINILPNSSNPCVCYFRDRYNNNEKTDTIKID